MCDPDAPITKRTAACMMAVVLITIILFSAFFISAEADHDCTGENCPICACILQCEKTLHQMGDGAALQIIAALSAVLILSSTILFVFRFSKDTLVSRKVRLNN